MFLPFSLAIGNRAKLRGLNLVGIRRKNFNKSEISRINDIHSIITRIVLNLIKMIKLTQFF